MYTNTIFSTFVLQVLGGFDEMLMDERTYGWKNGRSETLTYRRTDGQIDRWKDGRDPLIELRGTWKMDQQMLDRAGK